MKRTKPKAGFESSPVEIYPNMPEHTIENEYIADMERDKTEDTSCSKVYNEHNIVKGFTARYKGESALKVFFIFLF